MTTDDDNSSSSDSTDASVGSGDYVVQEGDCIASISYDNGHYWKTVWNDSGNAELKQKRTSPFLLLPGDRVTIPPIQPGEASGATEAQHRFVLKGVPAIVQIKILEAPEPPAPSGDASDQESQEGVEFVIEEVKQDPTSAKPAANVPYDVFIDDVSGPSGSTDGQGMMKVAIMPNARELRIRLHPGESSERELKFFLGGLDPVDTSSGQAQRLANLAYDVDPSGQDTDGLEQALELFQNDQGLDPPERRTPALSTNSNKPTAANRTTTDDATTPNHDRFPDVRQARQSRRTAHRRRGYHPQRTSYRKCRRHLAGDGARHRYLRCELFHDHRC